MSKLQAPCSVCLRTIQLRGERPLRHGFSAIGVRHGANSGYHTGPCGGSNFPHLGISTEGTVWALEAARQRLQGIEAQLLDLAAYPELIWYPRQAGSHHKVRGGLPDISRAVTLRHDKVEAYASDGRPTYANEHRRRVATLIDVKSELERAIAAYTRVLATWKPEPATAAPVKGETVHMAMPRRNVRFGAWEGILCRSTTPSQAVTKTTDPALVDCRSCKKQLGLPP